MSAAGCCDHCGDEIVLDDNGDPTEVPLCEYDQHSNAHATWDDEHCPACDERADIDAAITAYLRSRSGHDLITEGVGRALDIVRGDPPGQPSQHPGGGA